MLSLKIQMNTSRFIISYATLEADPYRAENRISCTVHFAHSDYRLLALPWVWQYFGFFIFY